MKITDSLYIALDQIIFVTKNELNDNLQIWFDHSQELPFIISDPEKIKLFIQKYDEYLNEPKMYLNSEPECIHPRYQFDISKIKPRKPFEVGTVEL